MSDSPYVLLPLECGHDTSVHIASSVFGDYPDNDPEWCSLCDAPVAIEWARFKPAVKPLMVPYEDIRSSFELALKGRLSYNLIRMILDEVDDYVTNHYGD